MEPYVVTPYGFTTALDLPALAFREAREKPFDLYGLYAPHEGGVYRRLPQDVADATSPGVAGLARNTAGGRVRFATDSDYVAIHAVLAGVGRMDHFPLTGSAGFDLYVKLGARYRYYGTFRPGFNVKDSFEGVLRFATREMREIMIHFPLYSGVESLYIGLRADAAVDHGARYRYDRPVVYYGSSITQGGCASHPGNAYQALISIDTDSDFLNLGFSGNARGEASIRDYMASLDMSVFVLDYDHNAPNAEHLKNTHAPLFAAIRAAHPTLPVIFVTKPDTNLYAFGASHGRAFDDRRSIIHETYRQALLAGDKNVYFIDGDSLFAGPHRDACTVDGCHPNDVGFFRMAEVIGAYVAPVLR